MFAVEFCDSDDRNQQPTRDSASSERKLWASYGPVPESAPSETSVNLEKHTVASSLTHSPDFVHLLRAFYDAPSTDCDLLSAARDIWWSLVNRSGIMANACEMTITAALTAMLSKHLVRQVGQYWSTTRRAHVSHSTMLSLTETDSTAVVVGMVVIGMWHSQALWTHQHKLGTWGVPDVCLLVHTPTGLKPLAVIEAGMSDSARSESKVSKAEQLYSYIGKLFELAQWQLPILGIELLDLGLTVKRVVVRGYSLSRGKHKASISRLIEHPLEAAADLVGLVAMLDRWSELSLGHLQSGTTTLSGEWTHFRKVTIANGSVWKEYDYRHCDADPSDWRRESQWSETEIPGAEVINITTQLQVLRYPFVPSSDRPTIAHLADVIEQLGRLHERGICHGDIRRWNMVLCDPTTIAQHDRVDEPAPSMTTTTTTVESRSNTIVVKSHLIDFDMAGQAGARTYSPHYRTEALQDTERHPEAQPSALLQKAHDRHSMAWIMIGAMPPNASESLRWAWEALSERARIGDPDVNEEAESDLDISALIANNELERLHSLVSIASAMRALAERHGPNVLLRWRQHTT